MHTVSSIALAAILVCATAGCRIHFDEIRNDASVDSFGVTPDSAPITLACNTTVKLADVIPTSVPNLSVAATTTGLVASWIDDAGTVGAIALRLTAPDVAEIVRVHDNLFGDPPASRTVASIAANGATVMVAAHSMAGVVTSARRFDAELAQPIAPTALGTRLDSSRGVAVLPGTDDFAMASPATTGNGSEVARFRGDATTATDALAVPGAYPEHALFAIADRVVLVGADAGQCQVRALDLVSGMSGTLQNWGPTGMCSAARATPVPGTNELAVLRVNASACAVTLATLTGNTLSIGTTNMSTFFTEQSPRITATVDGYWMTRVLGDQIFYDRFDRAGTTIATAVDLETPVPPLGHDVVVRDGTPYAIWIGGGLWLARLCP